jgi:hypothetical protein
MRMAVVAFVIVGCGPAVLPPPAAPAREMPAMEAPQPEAGKGQVAIAADEPSLVEEVTGHFEGVGADGFPVDGLTYRTVCPVTPCIANVELGSRDVRLTSLADPEHSGTGTIVVGDQPSAYRYALGHNTGPAVGRQFGGAYALTFGGLGVIGGAILIGIGQPHELDVNGNPSTGPNLRPWGMATAVVSTALIAYGWHLLRGSEGHAQEGTGVQWTP